MKINSTGILTQRHVAYQRPRGVSKKHVLSLSKGSSSPALSQIEGKAAGIFARRAYFQSVSTEKWRHACEKPLSAFVATSAKEDRGGQGTPLADFFNSLIRRD